MEENIIKVKSLKYFNPFVRIKDQLTDLIISDIFFSNINEQQLMFLSMACSDDMENYYKEDEKRIDSTTPPDGTIHETKQSKNCCIQKLYLIRRMIEKHLSSYIIPSKYTDCTKENVVKLNNRITKLTSDIKKYQKTMKKKEHDAILYEYLDGINVPLEHKELYRRNIPYVFYLQDIMRTFKLFNDTNNKQHMIFAKWNKIFNFQNDNELFNFQGCLGLLLMDEFCLHYRTNQLKCCILCVTLMTNLCMYSPIYKRMEREKSKQLNIFLEKEKKIKADRSRAGSKTKNEEFKQWCINYNTKNFHSHRDKARYLAEYYQKHYEEIIKKFPDTTLTQVDPFQSIYKWLLKNK